MGNIVLLVARRLKIAVIGEPFFGRLISQSLNKHTQTLSLKYFDTSNSRGAVLGYLATLPFADLVLSVGGSLTGGGALKAALNLKKPILMEFIGSDVLQASVDLKSGDACQRILKNSRFFSNAPWLEKELSDVGIFAPFFPDFLAGVSTSPAIALPPTFSVLCYGRDTKEDLYGLPHIIQCANAFPDVEFKVAGLNYTHLTCPPNLKILGWVQSFERELERSTVHLRLTSHDGIAHTVVQALALGRWVVRSQHMPGTLFARNAEEALPHLSRLKKLHEEGTLGLNIEGQIYAKEMFDMPKVVKALERLLIMTCKKTINETTKFAQPTP